MLPYSEVTSFLPALLPSYQVRLEKPWYGQSLFPHRSSQSCSECVLKHVTRTTGIFSYYNTGLIFLTVIPAKESSHLKGMLNCQFPVRFPAKTVCTKIFSHNEYSPFPSGCSIRATSPKLLFCIYFIIHAIRENVKPKNRRRDTDLPYPPCGFSCIHLVHADIRNPSLQLC